MGKSIVISVKKGDKLATHLPPVELKGAGIHEVKDLQKWVLDKPEVLGEPLLVLDDQFTRYDGARDRPDIICVDRGGNFVVVELKTTESADYADLQSLRYAAMLRSWTLEDAAQVLSESERGKENGISKDLAREKILEFIRQDEDDSEQGELESEPRIIIASSGFSKQLLTTAAYLQEHNIRITCIVLGAYSVGPDHIIIVPDIVFPIPEIEDYTYKIRKKEEAIQSANRSRAPHSLPYLYRNGEIHGGELLLLRHELPEAVRPHFKEDDPRFRAVVVIDGDIPALRWESDGVLYSPSELAAKVFKELLPAHPEHLSLNGSKHWGTTKESLTNWAKRVREGKGGGPSQ